MFHKWKKLISASGKLFISELYIENFEQKRFEWKCFILEHQRGDGEGRWQQFYKGSVGKKTKFGV